MDEKNNDILDDLEHDEFEDDIDPSDYFDDDYCYECQGYGDDYQVDEDGDWVCMCDSCVHNSNNWEDGYWIGDDY